VLKKVVIDAYEPWAKKTSTERGDNTSKCVSCCGKGFEVLTELNKKLEMDMMETVL